MKLDKQDIIFIEENMQSDDVNELIEALNDFTIFTMDENDEITDIGRQAERIIDKIVYGD